MIWAALTAAIFAGDLVVKDRMEKALDDQQTRHVLRDRILLRKLHNPGFILQKGERFPWIVKLLPLIVMLPALFLYAVTVKIPGHLIQKTGGAFLFGGGMNNLYERWKKGYVTDYFSFNTKWEKLKKVVFNLSDIFIMAGAFLVCIGEIFQMKK